jgi:hypothetical protein
MFAGLDVSIFGLGPQKRSSLTQAIKAGGGQVHYVPTAKVPSQASFIYNFGQYKSLFFSHNNIFILKIADNAPGCDGGVRQGQPDTRQGGPEEGPPPHLSAVLRRLRGAG